jgi:hypothetical protein
VPEDGVIVSVPQSANSTPLGIVSNLNQIVSGDSPGFAHMGGDSSAALGTTYTPNTNTSVVSLFSHPVSGQLFPRSWDFASANPIAILAGPLTGVILYYPNAGVSDTGHFLHQRLLLSSQDSQIAKEIEVNGDVVPVATVAIVGGSVAALSAVFSLCLWTITGFAAINPTIATLFLIASGALVLMGIALQKQSKAGALSPARKDASV